MSALEVATVLLIGAIALAAMVAAMHMPQR